MPDQAPAPEAAPAPAAASAPAATPKKKVPTSQKRRRQALRRRAINTPVHTGAKHAVARAVRLIEEGDWPAAETAVKGALSALDRAAAKGVIERNNAARRKARLAHRLNKAKGGTKS